MAEQYVIVTQDGVIQAKLALGGRKAEVHEMGDGGVVVDLVAPVVSVQEQLVTAETEGVPAGDLVLPETEKKAPKKAAKPRKSTAKKAPAKSKSTKKASKKAAKR